MISMQVCYNVHTVETYSAGNIAWHVFVLEALRQGRKKYLIKKIGDGAKT